MAPRVLRRAAGELPPGVDQTEYDSLIDAASRFKRESEFFGNTQSHEESARKAGTAAPSIRICGGSLADNDAAGKKKKPTKIDHTGDKCVQNCSKRGYGATAIKSTRHHLSYHVGDKTLGDIMKRFEVEGEEGHHNGCLHTALGLNRGPAAIVVVTDFPPRDPGADSDDDDEGFNIAMALRSLNTADVKRLLAGLARAGDGDGDIVVLDRTSWNRGERLNAILNLREVLRAGSNDVIKYHSSPTDEGTVCFDPTTLSEDEKTLVKDLETAVSASTKESSAFPETFGNGLGNFPTAVRGCPGWNFRGRGGVSSTGAIVDSVLAWVFSAGGFADSGLVSNAAGSRTALPAESRFLTAVAVLSACAQEPIEGISFKKPMNVLNEESDHEQRYFLSLARKLGVVIENAPGATAKEILDQVKDVCENIVEDTETKTHYAQWHPLAVKNFEVDGDEVEILADTPPVDVDDEEEEAPAAAAMAAAEAPKKEDWYPVTIVALFNTKRGGTYNPPGGSGKKYGRGYVVRYDEVAANPTDWHGTIEGGVLDRDLRRRRRPKERGRKRKRKRADETVQSVVL